MDVYLRRGLGDAGVVGAVDRWGGAGEAKHTLCSKGGRFSCKTE